MTNSLFATISSWIVLVTGGAFLIWAAFAAIWALINLWSRTSKAGREFVKWIYYRKQFSRWMTKYNARRYSRQKSLEDYLRCDLARNVIDHSLRAALDQRGRVRVYIHPQGIYGDTLDLLVDEDDTIPLQILCKCGTKFIASCSEEIPPHKCLPPEPPANLRLKKGFA